MDKTKEKSKSIVRIIPCIFFIVTSYVLMYFSSYGGTLLFIRHLGSLSRYMAWVLGLIIFFNFLNNKLASRAERSKKAKKSTFIHKSSKTIKSKIGKANVNKSNLISKANSETAEFYGLFEQYKRNPAVIKNGVFRERASAVLSKMGTTVIIPDDASSARIILP